MCVSVRSAFHVRAHHRHNLSIIEVLENEVNTFSPPLLSIIQLLSICSVFTSLILLVLSFLFYSFFSFLLSFFPPITELGPGCLDQCHHSGWQRGRAQQFPGWLNGLCGCLSSFWVFPHWFSAHLSGELSKERWKHMQDTVMKQLSLRQLTKCDTGPWQIGVSFQQFGVQFFVTKLTDSFT